MEEKIMDGFGLVKGTGLEAIAKIKMELPIVNEFPVFYSDVDEQGKPFNYRGSQRHKAIVSDGGKGVWVVSDKYHLMRHQKAVDFVSKIPGIKNADIRASWYDYGAYFKIEAYMEPFKLGSENFQIGFTAVNSYDRSTSFRFFGSVLRQVCSNGAMAPVIDVSVQSYHTKKQINTVKVLEGWSEKVKMSLTKLWQVGDAIPAEELKDLWLTYIPKKWLKEHSPEVLEEKATLWEIWNGITNFASHSRTRGAQWADQAAKKVWRYALRLDSKGKTKATSR